MDSEYARFEDLLVAATEQIAGDYFHLPVAGADAVYRERVYCYELYHQLRCLWDGFPFSIGGEVDKRGHPHFEDGPMHLQNQTSSCTCRRIWVGTSLWSR